MEKVEETLFCSCSGKLSWLAENKRFHWCLGGHGFDSRQDL